MNLSSALIIDRLSSRFLFNIVGKTSESMILGRPVFISASRFSPDSLIYIGYIRRNDEVPNIATHSIFLTKGRILDLVKDKFDCILIFDENADLQEVANYIQDIFTMYEEWHRDLMELALSGASLTEFLDRSQVIFANPIKIHDKDFKFIAWSGTIDTSPNLSFLQNDSTPKQILSDYMMDASYRDTYSQKKAAIFPAMLTGYRTAYYNVYNKNRFLCRILIIETIRQLRESDLYFLEILGKQLDHVLSRDQPYQEPSLSTLNSLLFRLLSGEHVDEFQLNSTLSTYGWTSECKYACIKLSVDKIDMQNHAVTGLQKEIETVIPECCAVEFENDIAVFVHISPEGKPLQDLTDTLKGMIRDRNMRAGISDTYAGFIDLFQLLYKQAGIALEVGMRYAPFKWIHYYSDILQNYILECCTRDLPAQMVVSPEIRAIHHYDIKHETEYLQTLKTYLDNNMQAVATAKAMFIHRTTFLYRIDKLIDKFHLKLDDPQKRLIYHLSILLIEQY